MTLVQGLCNSVRYAVRSVPRPVLLPLKGPAVGMVLRGRWHKATPKRRHGWHRCRTSPKGTHNLHGRIAFAEHTIACFALRDALPSRCCDPRKSV